MKKITLLVIMLSMHLIGEWKIDELKGDELKGTESRKVYSMMNSSGVVRLRDKLFKGEPVIIIISNNGIFNYKTEYHSIRYKWLLGLVGIYDENKTLVKRGNIFIGVSDDSDLGVVNDPIVVGEYNNRELFNVAHQILKMEIYNALCKTGWSVRFVAQKFSGPDLDVTILADDMFKKIEWIEENRKRLLQEKEKREREAAIEQEKKKAAEREQKRIEKLKEKERKISYLKSEKEDIERRIKNAESKGYVFSAKKYKRELKEIIESIRHLENDGK